MPGARSSRSCVRKLGWISAMRGSSRWLTKPPVSSTTIHARSNSRPVSMSRLSSTAMPAQDFTGCTKSEERLNSTSLMRGLCPSTITRIPGWTAPGSLRSRPPRGAQCPWSTTVGHFVALGGRAGTRMKLIRSSRCELHGVADLLKSAHQAQRCLVSVGAIEVGGAQVVPFGAVAQHVPGGREHRGGHRDDGLLDATARAQAVELRLQVAALDLDGGPSGL